MPDIDRFLKGFHIYQGLVLDGYQLTNTSSTEQQIVRYRKYSYPITLTFTFTGKHSKTDLLPLLKRHVGGKKVIYSEYGNPYECSFGKLNIIKQSDKSIVIKTIGVCIRV